MEQTAVLTGDMHKNNINNQSLFIFGNLIEICFNILFDMNMTFFLWCLLCFIPQDYHKLQPTNDSSTCICTKPSSSLHVSIVSNYLFFIDITDKTLVINLNQAELDWI